MRWIAVAWKIVNELISYLVCIGKGIMSNIKCDNGHLSSFHIDKILSEWSCYKWWCLDWIVTLQNLTILYVAFASEHWWLRVVRIWLYMNLMFRIRVFIISVQVLIIILQRRFWLPQRESFYGLTSDAALVKTSAYKITQI